MRSLRVGIAALVLVAAIGGTALAGDTPWFDLHNCSMCKPLSSRAGLLEHTSWEQHPISNGIVSVTTVDPEHIKDFKAAQVEMEKIGARLQGGEQMYLCGSCTALGVALMKDVQHEAVPTSRGSVWILTSTSPEVVAELQGWAKRNGKEMEKMKSAEM
jgi:hypothetical protein